MSAAIDDFLATKAEAVRAEHARLAPRGENLDALRRRTAAAPAPPSLAAAIRAGRNVALIAEFKRRSPTEPVLGAGEKPERVAQAYVAAGAAAVSILTDEDDFGGSIQDLAVVAHAVSVPVLRKDFIVDHAAVIEARGSGAAAVLLIAAMLPGVELARLLETAAAIGCEALVEVHDEDELRRALDAGAALVGINNRDLRSLKTDLGVTERLASLVPGGIGVVSESGVRSAADVARLRDAGAHAVLVGSALLRETGAVRDALVAGLAGVPR